MDNESFFVSTVYFISLAIIVTIIGTGVQAGGFENIERFRLPGRQTAPSR